MTIVLTFLFWCVLVVISTIRFYVTPRYSELERERLVNEGDKTAEQEAAYLEKLPLLNSLQGLLSTVVVVAFVTYSVATYGIGSGMVVGLVALLLVPIGFRVPFICQISDRLRDRALPYLDKVVTALRPLFRWLRARDITTSAPMLHSQAELLELVHRSPGVASPEQFKRLKANLTFDNQIVKDIMTPRTMLHGVEASETLGPLVIDELYKTGYSRFPVYERDLDHVVGMLYLHDLIDIKTGAQHVDKAMQKRVYFIREDQNLAHALHGFLSTRHHLFIVVNQYRETVGLVSLEDVMEALIGEPIVDEFDSFDNLRAVAEHNPHGNNKPEGRKDI